MVLIRRRAFLEFSAVGTAALLLVFAGCGLFSSRDGAGRFNHKIHAEVGITCDVCHEEYSTGLAAGMPSYEMCLACHGADKGEEAAPYEMEIQKHAPEESFAAISQYRDLLFSHALHQKQKVACAVCHGDIASSAEPSIEHEPAAKTCVECHEEKGVSGECSVCHQDLRKDAPPPTHNGAAWKRIHGREAAHGMNDRGHGESCNICHAQATCDHCHRVEKPQDHTEFFRVRGHGSFAATDRSRCMACHREDYCIRCHRETAPQNHFSATWGGKVSRHCLYCHTDSGPGSCTTCHKAAPSHRMASPVPPPPHPGAASDCRACHLRPPHADNGMPCTVCHK